MQRVMLLTHCTARYEVCLCVFPVSMMHNNPPPSLFKPNKKSFCSSGGSKEVEQHDVCTLLFVNESLSKLYVKGVWESHSVLPKFTTFINI